MFRLNILYISYILSYYVCSFYYFFCNEITSNHSQLKHIYNMMKNNGRCEKGKRCYKTIHTYPFVKFNFICAIKYCKVYFF